MSTELMAVGYLLGGLGSFTIAILLLIFVLQRIFGWLDDRGYITYTGNVPTWGSLGNAAMEVQKQYQPQYEYVLKAIEEQQEKREEDEAGGPASTAKPEAGATDE